MLPELKHWLSMITLIPNKLSTPATVSLSSPMILSSTSPWDICVAIKTWWLNLNIFTCHKHLNFYLYLCFYSFICVEYVSIVCLCFSPVQIYISHFFLCSYCFYFRYFNSVSLPFCLGLSYHNMNLCIRMYTGSFDINNGVNGTDLMVRSFLVRFSVVQNPVETWKDGHNKHL